MLSARVSALEPSLIREMAQRKKPTSIDLSLGEPAVAPDSALIASALAQYQAGDKGYTHNAGLMELREAVAHYENLPSRARAENVMITVGSEEAIYVALLSAVDPGSDVLVPEPGYPAYPGIVKLVGGRPVSYILERDQRGRPALAAIEAAMTDNTQALVLNLPSNPFGATMDSDELSRVAELCERRGVTLISDEIYKELYFGEGSLDSVCRMTERSVFVSGFSKSCALTGFRIGYLIAPAPFITKAMLAHQLIVTCAPRLSQLIALEILADPSVLRAHLPFYAEARARAEKCRGLLPPDAPLFLGDGAFYAVVDVERYANGDPLALAIALADEEDVITVPGTGFGPTGNWFVRLSYAQGADVIERGLERMGRFLSRRSPGSAS